MKSIVIVLTLLAMFVAGCEALLFVSTPTPTFEGMLLPFETIVSEKEGYASNEEGSEVYLLIESGDVAQIESLMRPEHLPLLQKVDFNTHAVIAVFRGGGVCAAVSAVTIERLILKDDVLTVQAEFSDPAPDRACAHDFSMPYHLVQVKETDIPLQGMSITLEIQKVELR